jgi:hypothetical protein
MCEKLRALSAEAQAFLAQDGETERLPAGLKELPPDMWENGDGN